MTDKSGGSIAKIEFHAPYHPNVKIRILDKYFSIDGACSSRFDKYIHWLTHFHFDHIRSSVAGGADFLLKQNEKIIIFTPEDRTPVEGDQDVFEIHKSLYQYHSKGKRLLIPVNEGEKIYINNTTIEAVRLKHSIPNNAIFIKNELVDFTIFVTGDWLGSDEENREAILSRKPNVLVSECRYFKDENYALTCERMHTHVNDLIALKELLPETIIIPYHISRTFSNLEYIKNIFDAQDLVFGKKILFYDNINNYEVTEPY
ncbi:MAG TPA: MBL fold metallo-hydrolase [Candidatus Methanofastidiosa archaeon]|nr:MBL fold metallo-hydrolase [Candidatus Methanofastidiosa archaeon]